MQPFQKIFSKEKAIKYEHGGCVINFVADTHVTSTSALLCPEIELDDGNIIYANSIQKWLWDCWLDYVEIVKKKSKGKKLYNVFNGDLRDGNHHGTSQLISINEADALKATRKTLEPMYELTNSNFIIKGTEAHDGISGYFDEIFASTIIDRIVKEGEGSYSWWNLLACFEDVLFHVQHHGRIGGRYHTKSNSLNIIATEMMLNFMSEPRFPDIVMRAHTHKFADTGLTYPIRVLSQPCWQLNTAYGYKIMHSCDLPDVGGIIFECCDGEYSVEHILYKPKRKIVWTEKSEK